MSAAMAPLRKTLDEVSAATLLPLAEKRRLWRLAVLPHSGDRPPARETAAATEGGGSALVALEDALCLVGRLAGEDAGKTQITPAKAWLRQHGAEGRRLAGRISRLSKVRNGVAHPDASLLADIQLLVDSTCLDESEPLPAKRASVESSSGISEPEPHSVLPKFNEYYGVEFIDAASQTDLNQSGGAVEKGMGQEGVEKVFEQRSEIEHARSVLEAALNNVLAAEDALVEARAVAARASYELEHVGAGLGT